MSLRASIHHIKQLQFRKETVHLSASLLLGGYLSLAANGLALPEIEPRGDVLHAHSSWNFMTWTGPTGQTVKLYVSVPIKTLSNHIDLI